MPQYKFPNSRTLPFVLISCFAFSQILLTGCSNSPEKTDTQSDLKTESAMTPSSATSSVAVVKSGDASSPATTADVMPPVDAEADEVCMRFMSLLKSGNRIAAENLLTRTALTTTTKEGLKLQPMGGPTANYIFKDVRFATSKQKLAQVSYTIADTIDGESFEMPITWLARKQKKGWRISGVILELEEGRGPDLLSFESMADVAKIKLAAGEEVANSTETRQADASNSTHTSNLKLK